MVLSRLRFVRSTVPHVCVQRYNKDLLCLHYVFQLAIRKTSRLVRLEHHVHVVAV